MDKVSNSFKCKRRDTCKYRSKEGSIYGCDYTFITGELRIKGLPRDKWGAEFCDKYDPAEKKRTRKPPASFKPLDDNVMMALYKQGLSDYAMAKKLQVGYSRVKSWREGKALPRNIPEPRIGAIDPRRALELYQEGLTDRDIGLKMNTSTTTVRRWRVDANLPPNRNAIRWRQAEELYDMGLTDVEISVALGCSTESVGKWRRSTGREGNGARTVVRVGERLKAEIHRLYDRGLLAGETAIILGISSQTVLRRQRQMGLPGNSVGNHRKKEIEGVEEIKDGFTWDEETQLFWIFVNGRLRAVTKDQAEAGELYEKVRRED